MGVLALRVVHLPAVLSLGPRRGLADAVDRPLESGLSGLLVTHRLKALALTSHWATTFRYECLSTTVNPLRIQQVNIL